MSKYLIFRLFGPLSAWGETAVGEVRPSAAWPGRSAVIGLLAAALGVRREEEARQQALANSFGVAVCVENGGELLRDYHTTQVPPERRGVRHDTRRDELNADTLHTILSQRDYRCDALYKVAIWMKDGTQAAATLEQLAAALNRPRYVLYLGRKSCPVSLPLAPQLVKANDLRKAFDEASFPSEPWLDALPYSGERLFIWEDGCTSGMEALHVSPRRDEPVSRQRWQFSERDEYYYSERRATVVREEA